MTTPLSKLSRSTVVTLIILGLMVAANFCVILLVFPKFEQIYRDALPGSPLPAATRLMLSYRFLFALLAVAWLVGGGFMVRQRHRLAVLVLKCGLLWCFLQIGFFFYALFVPMIGLTGGLSDVPDK